MWRTSTPSNLPPQPSIYAVLGKQKSPVVNTDGPMLSDLGYLWTNELNLANLRTARGDPEHLQCPLAHSKSAELDPEDEALPYPLEMDAMLKITSCSERSGWILFLIDPSSKMAVVHFILQITKTAVGSTIGQLIMMMVARITRTMDPTSNLYIGVIETAFHIIGIDNIKLVAPAKHRMDLDEGNNLSH
ncbi:uncharacterized protein LOC144592800 [Rhinoraja longicauda]